MVETRPRHIGQTVQNTPEWFAEALAETGKSLGEHIAVVYERGTQGPHSTQRGQLIIDPDDETEAYLHLVVDQTAEQEAKHPGRVVTQQINQRFVIDIAATYEEPENDNA